MTNTTDTTTTDITTAIDIHLAAYCDPDPERRCELIASVWHTDGALIDPPFEGAGHNEIAAMADVVLTHYTDHTFRRTTNVDSHHNFARYAWELVDTDGTVAVGGTDIVEFDDAGRLVRVIGFFGDLTAA
jgi:hypothetical protein